MGIEASGTIIVAVDRDTAFAVVRNPERLARCIPGCRDLQEIAPDKYTAVLTSQVAFMTVSVKVNVDLVRVEPPSALEARISGDAVGLAGHVVATATLHLDSENSGQTVIRYSTDVGLTGKLGGLGQSVFRVTSANMARKFADNLKAEIERGEAGQTA